MKRTDRIARMARQLADLNQTLDAHTANIHPVFEKILTGGWEQQRTAHSTSRVLRFAADNLGMHEELKLADYEAQLNLDSIHGYDDETHREEMEWRRWALHHTTLAECPF